MINCLSPALFYAPNVHLRALGEMWVDQKLSKPVWSGFIDKLSQEWKSLTLYVGVTSLQNRRLQNLQATVLLNANVAFLAIQSIDKTQKWEHRSSAQIASYASTVFSVGSIILGLLLDRQNRTKGRETALDAVSTHLNDRMCSQSYL